MEIGEGGSRALQEFSEALLHQLHQEDGSAVGGVVFITINQSRRTNMSHTPVRSDKRVRMHLCACTCVRRVFVNPVTTTNTILQVLDCRDLEEQFFVIMVTVHRSK